MMNHQLLVAILLLSIPHSPTTTAIEPPTTKWWILNICSHTHNPYLCSNVFNRYKTRDTDIFGLTEIAITQSLKNATNFRALTREALETEKSQRVRRGYETCITSYQTLVDDMKDANLDFKGGDYSNLVFHLSTTFKYVDDCFKALRKLSPRGRHLGVQNVKNRVLLQMSIHCAYIIDK